MARVGAAALALDLGFEGRGQALSTVNLLAVSSSPGLSVLPPSPHPTLCLLSGFRQDTRVSSNEARGPEKFFSHERRLKTRTPK